MTVTRHAEVTAEPSTLSPRDREFLSVTLELLAQHGYDRLTVDAVAARAHASKATVYRRWPSKADLVLAAFSEGIRQVVVPPDTGALRSDLLRLGQLIREQARQHTSTIRAVLVEASHNSALNDVFRLEFIEPWKALIEHVMHHAAVRGELDSAIVGGELWDLLPGYLLFRSIIAGRPPTGDTVRVLVDDVVIPGLTRRAQQAIRLRSELLQAHGRAN
jgi:AcrR family transcriptional regulator